MAHHSASKKAIRSSARRNLRNRAYKSKIKTAIKQLEESTSKEDREKNFKIAQEILDRASKRNIIKRNTASRKISRLKKKLNSAEAGAGA